MRVRKKRSIRGAVQKKRVSARAKHHVKMKKKPKT